MQAGMSGDFRGASAVTSTLVNASWALGPVSRLLPWVLIIYALLRIRWRISPSLILCSSKEQGPKSCFGDPRVLQQNALHGLGPLIWFKEWMRKISKDRMGQFQEGANCSFPGMDILILVLKLEDFPFYYSRITESNREQYFPLPLWKVGGRNTQFETGRKNKKLLIKRKL